MTHAREITPLSLWKVGLADSTLKAYAADAKAFGDWARAAGIATLLPVTPELVAAFLESQARDGFAFATIQRRAATLSKLHRAACLPNPIHSELVRLTLRGIARTVGTGQRQAFGLSQRHADQIVANLGDGLRHCRDAALVLCGRDLLARSSELVTLCVEDVTPTADGALVEMRRRKTSNEAVTYFLGGDAATALHVWITRARIMGGLVFRSVSKAGRASKRGLAPRDVGRILKKAAKAGLIEQHEGVSGHSLRTGMAQDLVDGGAELAAVMQVGGWTSPRMAARYSAKILASRNAVAKFHAKR